MKLKRLSVLLLTVSLIGVPALAQFPRPVHRESPRVELTPEEKKDLEKRALGLLDDLVNEAMSMRLIENRLQVLCFAAGILWKRDENRARGLLREAVNQFMAMEQPPAEAGPRAGRIWHQRNTLRSQLIQTLAERDPKLALDFLKASRPAMAAGAPNSGAAGIVPPDGRYGPDFEKQYEMQLAAQIAENDPQLALQLAEEALKQEANHQVVEIWRRLQDKDPKAASRLATQILTRLRAADAMKSHSSSGIINEMVFDLRERVRAGKEKKDDAAQNRQSAVSTQELEQTYRELLELVVAAAMKVTAANLMDINEQGQARNLLSQAQSLLPDVEKYLSARLAPLRAKLNQFDKAFYHPPATVENHEELEKKTAAELVALADKAKGEAKDILYSQALSKSMQEGNTDLAKQIASQHLRGSGQDEFLAQQIDTMEREKAVKEGKLDEARKTLDKLPTDAERASAILRMAETVKYQTSRKQLLDEARAVLGDKMETRAQVEAQLALAMASLDFDADQSFTLLEAAIDKLNAVLAASVMLMKFTQEMQSDNDEMQLNQGGMGYWFTGGFDDKILAFARKDFARTQAAIARWQHVPTRLTMNMALVSMILDDGKPETRSRYFFGERDQ